MGGEGFQEVTYTEINAYPGWSIAIKLYTTSGFLQQSQALNKAPSCMCPMEIIHLNCAKDWQAVAGSNTLKESQ